jgi:hypothetical protein
MRLNKLLTVLSLIVIASSCSTSKILRFNQKEDNIIKTESLRNFLASNKNPKVVLRVNDATYTVTEDENVDYLYNAIENQLLASGFIVRDRQLFNQIIGNNDNTIDYAVLKDKSDTDLIIELTKLDPQVIYKTNKYYNKNNEEKVEPSTTHKRFGASVEFKVVLISSNEFAGIYKFNYTPCVDGCIISKTLTETTKERKAREKEGTKPYEGVEKDEFEIFIKDATVKLVSKMRDKEN